MALLIHRGGALTVTDKNGNSVTLHYGPGLHKKCPTCKVPANKLCKTSSGNPLNKIHADRGR